MNRLVKLIRLIPTLIFSAGLAYANCDAKIARELSDLSFDENTPGYSFMVTVNHKVVCLGSIGYKSDGGVEQIGITTQFNLASVSKMFTGAAILKLISSGQLSLETSVTEILPELKDTVSGDTKVKHLLNHSAALETYYVEYSKNSPYGAYSYHALDAFDEYNKESVLTLAAQFPVQKSQPGLSYEYNNTGYVFLALIVERVSGTTFENFVDKFFFKSLNMSNTEFARCDDSEHGNLAIDYFVTANKFYHLYNIPYLCVHGPSNIYSSVQDMTIWLESILSSHLFGAKTGAFLQSIELNDGSATGYGFGLKTSFFRGVPRYFHDGITFGYRTVVTMLPEQNAHFVVLANRSDIDSIDVMNVLSEWVLEKHFEGTSE